MGVTLYLTNSVAALYGSKDTTRLAKPPRQNVSYWLLAVSFQNKTRKIFIMDKILLDLI